LYYIIPPLPPKCHKNSTRIPLSSLPSLALPNDVVPPAPPLPHARGGSLPMLFFPPFPPLASSIVDITLPFPPLPLGLSKLFILPDPSFPPLTLAGPMDKILLAKVPPLPFNELPVLNELLEPPLPSCALQVNSHTTRSQSAVFEIL